MIDLICIVALLILVVGYVAFSQAEARRQADRIIASRQRWASREINRCITTLEKRGKSLFGFGRWGSEQDRQRVERLRDIRDNPVDQV